MRRTTMLVSTLLTVGPLGAHADAAESGSKARPVEAELRAAAEASARKAGRAHRRAGGPRSAQGSRSVMTGARDVASPAAQPGTAAGAAPLGQRLPAAGLQPTSTRAATWARAAREALAGSVTTQARAIWRSVARLTDPRTAPTPAMPPDATCVVDIGRP